ncbi:MAG TPA: Rieske (2Fe-2S) protein [Xanthobacteraceae bacterium]|nr:Rieske (2Fe-2S) protein [Xanthobacteraceae bacterium]
MKEQFVGRADEFKDGDRRIVLAGEVEIGLFKDKGEFYAYSNTCLHQFGPACEGLIIAKVEERIQPDKTSRGMYFSDTETHFVCPWHGYEYDLKTGECVGDRRLKLRRYDVVQRNGDLYVVG